MLKIAIWRMINMSKIKVGKDSIRIIPDTSKKTYEPVIQITKDKLMSSDEFKTFIMSDGRSDFSSMKTRKYSEKELNRILCDMGLRRESNHKTKFDDYVDERAVEPIIDLEAAHKKRYEASNDIMNYGSFIKDKFYSDFDKFISDLKKDIKDLNDTISDFLDPDGFVKFQFYPSGIFTDYAGLLDNERNYSKFIDSEFIKNFSGKTIKEFVDSYVSQFVKPDNQYRVSNFISIIMRSETSKFKSYSSHKYNDAESRMVSFVRYTYVFKKGDID